MTIGAFVSGPNNSAIPIQVRKIFMAKHLLLCREGFSFVLWHSSLIKVFKLCIPIPQVLSGKTKDAIKRKLKHSERGIDMNYDFSQTSKARCLYLKWKDTALAVLAGGLFILGLVFEIPVLSNISWAIFLVIEVVFSFLGSIWGMSHYT
ncbi:MAG: hypothetical protein ACOC43_03305 [Desulfohalobiaceae bacterium]